LSGGEKNSAKSIGGFLLAAIAELGSEPGPFSADAAVPFASTETTKASATMFTR
jgi:hypothetical protein